MMMRLTVGFIRYRAIIPPLRKATQIAIEGIDLIFYISPVGNTRPWCDALHLYKRFRGVFQNLATFLFYRNTVGGLILTKPLAREHKPVTKVTSQTFRVFILLCFCEKKCFFLLPNSVAMLSTRLV